MYTLDSFWYRGGKLSIVRNYNMADTTLQNWRLSRAEFYHYNLVGNIDSIVTQNPAGNVISRSIYTYTNFDHIKAAHYYDGISNQPAGEDRFYYEVIGQTAVAPYTQRKMTFFPNPVTDQLSINTGNTAGKSLRFTIHNLQGQQLSEIITSDSNPVINVVFLPVGTYILEVKGNDIAERLRFVKMR